MVQDNWYLFALFNERTIDGDLHLHFLMSVFRDSNGTRFVRQNISTNGFHIPPRVSARFDWFHPAQNWQMYWIFHHATDKVQGECRSRAKPPQFGFLPLHSVWNLTSRIHFNQQDSDGFKLYRSRRSKWQVLSNCKCGVTRTSSWGYKTVYEERKETQRM